MPSLPTVTTTQDRAALVASLRVTGKARTPHGFAMGPARTYPDRPYNCSPNVGLTTWHATPELAIARLVSL